ncbi:MAG: hypothetical protein ACQKBY_10150 [Verrucomicrobiales bacterium]
MKEPWSIQSRAHRCTITERPFADGETVHAALFPDPESSGYLRRDYCAEAWQARAADEPAPFSHWLSTYEKPVPEEKTQLASDDPESLLRRLIEEERAESENTRYILALMLERKKILKETDTQSLPSGLLRVYEHRKSGETFLIKDPGIPLADVARVQAEVTALLDPDTPASP